MQTTQYISNSGKLIMKGKAMKCDKTDLFTAQDDESPEELTDYRIEDWRAHNENQNKAYRSAISRGEQIASAEIFGQHSASTSKTLSLAKIKVQGDFVEWHPQVTRDSYCADIEDNSSKDTFISNTSTVSLQSTHQVGINLFKR